jgi:prepilin-type N-terminal cleavage/methylation domain-containing protein
MKKAFSLVELLVTCAIIAIMVAIVMGVYNNVNNSAVAVAQQKDTAELNQVMGMLHMSGGNIAAIVSSAALNPAQGATQAGELTYLLQQTIITANSKTQYGVTGGTTLPTTEAIIPYPYVAGTDNGRNRMVFSSTGVPSIATTGQGFIAVNRTSSKDWKTFSTPTTPTAALIYNNFNTSGGTSGIVPTTAAATAVTSAATPGTNTVTGATLVGSKYANNNAYVWNEDPGVTTSPNPQPALPTLINVAFVIAFSPSSDPANNVSNGMTVGTGAYNFTDYTGVTTANWTSVPIPLATAYIFAYNEDDPAMGFQAGPISLSAQLGTITSTATPQLLAANDPSIPAAFNGALANLGSSKGMLLTVPLNATLPLYPTNDWVTASGPASFEPLVITAGGGATGTTTTAVVPSGNLIAAGTPSINVPASLTYQSAVSVGLAQGDPSGVLTDAPAITDSNGTVDAAQQVGSIFEVDDSTDQIVINSSNEVSWTGADDDNPNPE